MLFTIGASTQVVAVSSYDEWPPAVRALPRVGSLLDPDTERILSLDPDLVITYGSQTALKAQLARAHIEVFSYRHAGLNGILQVMHELGVITDRQSDAERAIHTIKTRIEAVRQAVAHRERPRTVLVFERQPLELRQIYASGGTGFLHDILEAAGADNVFADVNRESVQPSLETLLIRAPDVILEVRSNETLNVGNGNTERAVWKVLSSLPAVRDDRVAFLYGDYLVVPGPRVADVTEAFARILHPDAFPTR
jgi:iron complex transport system substrate-binding protein